MPVNKSLAEALKKKYGKKAPSIYAAMENKGAPAFKKGLKTAKAENHTTATFPKKKGGLAKKRAVFAANMRKIARKKKA